MNPEIRDQWADALESGNYLQGIGALSTVQDDGTVKHCCLGVLCDLAVKAGAIPAPTRLGDLLGYGPAPCDAFLPLEVQEWAGLESDLVDFKINDGMYSAEHLNDTQHFTFSQIAALIRTQL